MQYWPSLTFRVFEDRLMPDDVIVWTDRAGRPVGRGSNPAGYICSPASAQAIREWMFRQNSWQWLTLTSRYSDAVLATQPRGVER